MQSEFEAIQAAMPAGTDVTDLAPFNFVVAYAPLGGQMVTDIVPYAQVTRYAKGMTTDDGNMTIDLEMITDIPLLNQ